ncbi:MAG: GerMN domain-containing protein [Clostridia bacterium]|nr:GerMN domain-containing protein [Clostridia bacterium]
MKKSFSILLLCLLTGFFIFANGQAQTDMEECRIYFVDRRLHRLIPLPFSPLRTPEKTAKGMVSVIIKGKDNNPEVLRLFPNIKDSISVKISSNTACVNLSGELSKHINKNAETERLCIYQIVNSLTSVEGIDYVRFTIDNEIKKDFLGFLDMREIFTADYYM